MSILLISSEYTQIVLVCSYIDIGLYPQFSLADIALVQLGKLEQTRRCYLNCRGKGMLEKVVLCCAYSCILAVAGYENVALLVMSPLSC